MLKKFTIYFALFFIVVFALLNYSSVWQEFRFWLTSESGQADAMSVTAAQMASRENQTPTPSVKPNGTPLPTAKIDPASGVTMSIPKIGITAPVIIEQSLDPKVIYRDLKKGVVYYAGSAMIGQPGSAVILGHSWTTPWVAGNYDSVFSLINKLAPGDGIKIQNGSTQFIYQVKGSLVFDPNSNDPKIDEFTRSDVSSIILVTCWPAGSSSRRLAVKADLVQ